MSTALTPYTGLITYSVVGINEVNQMLTSAPALIVANGYLKALEAASKFMEFELMKRVPIGNDLTIAREKLNESQVTVINIDTGLRGGTVAIGFGKNSYIANFLEYGHRMVGHAPEFKQLFSRKFPGQTHVLPDPFMRRAITAAADDAIEAFTISLSATVRALYGTP